MNQSSNTQLWTEIAGPAPAPAWAELVRRHSGRVFALALHILRSRSCAEDVVQETFLTAWEKRHQVSAPESLERWLLKIAAFKAIGVARASRRRKATQERFTAEGHATATPATPALQPESPPSELQPLLRQALESLPEQLRLPLLLQVCSGLSQKEVAQACQCHQTTVNRRTQEALARIRGSLKNAGYSAAVPAGTALEAMLRTDLGREAAGLPPDLSQRLLSLPERPATASGGARSFLRPGSPALGPLGWATTLGVAVTLGGGILWGTGSQPFSAHPAGQAQPAGAPDRTAHRSWHWSFERGPAQELELVSGTWEWRKSGAQPGGMSATSKVLVLFPLPPDWAERPLQVTLSLRSHEGQRLQFGADLAEVSRETVRPFPCRGWRQDPGGARPSVQTGTFYLDRNQALGLLDGKVSYRTSLDPHPAPGGVLLNLAHCDLQEILVREVDPSAIPNRETPAPPLGAQAYALLNAGLSYYRRTRLPPAVDRECSFGQGWPAGLKPLKSPGAGSCELARAGGDGPQFLRVRGRVQFLLSEELPPRPCLIEIGIRPLPGAASTWADCFWTDGQTIGAISYSRRQAAYQVHGAFCGRFIYLVDRWISHFIEDQPDRLYEYGSPYPQRRLAFDLCNIEVDSLQIRELPPHQLPVWVTDPTRLRAQLTQTIPLRAFLLGEGKPRPD